MRPLVSLAEMEDLAAATKALVGGVIVWDDGPSGEAILQIRAAVLCEDGRLGRWLRERRLSPFAP